MKYKNNKEDIENEIEEKPKKGKFFNDPLLEIDM